MTTIQQRLIQSIQAQTCEKLNARYKPPEWTHLCCRWVMDFRVCVEAIHQSGGIVIQVFEVELLPSLDNTALRIQLNPIWHRWDEVPGLDIENSP